MRRIIQIAAPMALALSPAPLLAQDEPDLSAMMGMLGGMAEKEPLTPEQEARLPAATAVVDRVLPQGTMGEMMGSMFDGILGPIMEMATPSAAGTLGEMLGAQDEGLQIEEDAAARALALLDPDWQERREREAEIMPVMITRAMTAMEPTIKKVMSELYAVNFDAQELAELDAFFATPTGANYARKSYTMAGDPRMLSGMMEAMPAMLGVFFEMEGEMAAATADLATPRGFDQLSAAERAQMSELTGMDEGSLVNQLSGPSADEDW